MRALFLLNLGSPKSTSTKDVRAYLDEFLNDPYVIDLPFIFRKLLVNGIILNTRPKKTAAAYEKIWQLDGSPLVRHTRDLAHKMKSYFDGEVVYGMRYGTPNIPETLAQLKSKGVTEIIFFPLYPQYSYAATESSIVEFYKWQKKILPQAKVSVIEDFFNHPEFISSLVSSIQEPWKRVQPDLLLLSYHGIPERQIEKTKDKKDYRAQCYETSRLITENLMARGLDFKVSHLETAFQSRLGRTKWIEPYTDIVLKELPKRGIKKLLVASPSFTADCLETLEEIKIRYRELFLESGGEFFEYIPCLNSSDNFAATIQSIIKDRTGNL